MKTKIIVILSALLLVSGAFMWFGFKEYRFQKSEAQRQSKNVEVLNKNFVSYKNAFGQTFAKVQSLKYTVNELKKNESELYKKLEQNKIKAKNVKSITKVETVSHVEFKTKIQYVDTTKCFEYENEYYTVNACYDNDSATVIVESKESLEIIPTIVPAHKFLFWTWGVKGVDLNVISNNPFSKISYLKYIELK